ncbi:MAG TPA: methyltransferase, partial [Gammaproteobacteria bacterium]|nr:methyltransferase [Gammaproteobacteria bacterium]
MECTTEALKMLENDSAIRIFNVVLSLPAVQTLHVAHELNLFELIGSDGALSLDELSKILHLQLRPLQALLSMCVGLDLITLNNNGNGCFALTDTAKNFLLKESPFYLGKALEVNLMNAEIFSFKSLKKALLENNSQIYAVKELFKTNEEQAELAKNFTRCMHGKSMGMAGQWPNKIDLSSNQRLLDIGGGSGAHSIGAVLRWPNLKATVYERPTAAEIAEEYIGQFELQNRIQTHIGDMFQDPFPSSDVHFYSDIFHDWPMETC